MSAFELFADLMSPDVRIDSPAVRSSEIRADAGSSPNSPVSPDVSMDDHDGGLVGPNVNTPPQLPEAEVIDLDALEMLVRRVGRAWDFSDTELVEAVCVARANPGEAWLCFSVLERERSDTLSTDD